MSSQILTLSSWHTAGLDSERTASHSQIPKMEKQQNLGFGSSPMVIYSHKLDHKKVAFLLCTIGLQVSQIWLCHSFWTTTSGYIHSLTGYFAIGLTTLFNSVSVSGWVIVFAEMLIKWPDSSYSLLSSGSSSTCKISWAHICRSYRLVQHQRMP